VKNIVTIMEESIGHILDLTPIGEKKERKDQEANINLSYFHGKDNVEACLDWEMKVDQLFACHHTSKERKVSLDTLSF